MAFSSVRLVRSVVLFTCLAGVCASAEIASASEVAAAAENLPDASKLLEHMEAAYAAVNDYRTNVEKRTFRSDGSVEVEKFLYTFKKPKSIRIDLESPHKGMILIYTDKDGRVTVQPGGLARLFKFHLAPDSRLLEDPSGQRIDQTDIGLLINHIAHSLRDQRKGRAEIAEEDGYIRIRVLAVDHFRENVDTLYQFYIDKKQWLPGKVEEFTPDGEPKRSIVFKDLRINNGFADSLFQLDGAANQKNG